MDTLTTDIELSCDDVDKLLDLLGHDGSTAEEWETVALVRSLYRQRHAFGDVHPPANLTIEVTQRQLDFIHRYFTPAAFGPGGREFRLKLARAFVALERLEDIPEIEEEPPADHDEQFGDEERRRLVEWKEREDGSPRKKAGPKGGTGR